MKDSGFSTIGRETGMSDQTPIVARPRFGRRRVAPHACIVTDHPHLLAFLADTLSELGFVTHDSGHGRAVAAATKAAAIDLLVIPVLRDGVAAAATLRLLAAEQVEAAVLLVGARNALPLAAAHQLGTELGLAMLAPVGAPFRIEEFGERIAHLAPPHATLQAPIDVEEALANGWLELWYQSKADLRSLQPCGAEALLRLRHPHWGIVEPARFLPDGHDLPWRTLCEFVVTRAVADWRGLAARGTPVDLAINVPIAVLGEPDFVRFLWGRLPDHPLFGGLTIEIACSEIVADIEAAQTVARHLRFCNVGVSVDDAGPEWTALATMRHFPFIEIKADGGVVNGCATDPAKHALCENLVQQARRVGVPAVAEGVETEADFRAVRALGFDMVQGFIYARPMDPKKFARTLPRLSVPVLTSRPMG